MIARLWVILCYLCRPLKQFRCFRGLHFRHFHRFQPYYLLGRSALGGLVAPASLNNTASSSCALYDSVSDAEDPQEKKLGDCLVDKPSDIFSYMHNVEDLLKEPTVNKTWMQECDMFHDEKEQQTGNATRGCHEDFQLRGATHFKRLQGDNGAMNEMNTMISLLFEGGVHTLNRPHAAEPT